MDRARYVVDAVVVEGRSVREVARAHGVSKSWVSALCVRYRAGGYDALARGVVVWATVIGFGSAALGSTIGTWATYGLSAVLVIVVVAVAAHHRRPASQPTAPLGPTRA